MRIKTISVTYERKINLGDYNSANIGLSLWADLDEDEDSDQAIADLQILARSVVRAEHKRLIKPGTITANGTA
jgi:hypothetical protein